MKLNFLFPGKTREPVLAELIDSYLKRLKPMVSAQVCILKGAPISSGSGAAAEARAREAKYISERCESGEYLVVLDAAGKLLSSPALAAQVESWGVKGVRAVNLVIGGPWGVDDSLKAKADLLLSLGPMTFPHDLARVMLLEQMYRAYTIINHIPYHK